MKKDQNKKINKPEKEIKDVEEEILIEKESLSAVEADEIEMLAKKAQENLDGWQRSLAEFENYKKRSAEMQKDLIKYSTQNVILQILPVIDNFHASTDHIPEDQKDNPWVTGIMYIQKQLENVLAENGIEEIEVKAGDNFDPVYHEAIGDSKCCDEKCDCKDEKKFKNKIKQVLTKGYKIGEKVIRPARVVVE